MSKKQINKCGGHCYDGCGCFSCDFWLLKNKKSYCMLFGSNDGVGKRPVNH